MKFVVFSLGCRVNIYEGQAMVKEFIARGHEATDKLEKADCYVLNTCSVTAEADKKIASGGCPSAQNKPECEDCGLRLQQPERPRRVRKKSKRI